MGVHGHEYCTVYKVVDAISKNRVLFIVLLRRADRKID